MKHYEKTLSIPASPENIFGFADNHANFSAHMNRSSWMMAGGRMITSNDESQGKQIGSHIRMSGKILGITIFLDEVVIVREPFYQKTWQTVGDIKLLVIGHYTMGFEIKPEVDCSLFRVFIDYGLPDKNIWFGRLFSGLYAKWCVNQMASAVQNHFNK